METTAESIYYRNIDILITATNEGGLTWKKQNPSTYYYELDLPDGKFVTSIQRVVLTGGYVFQIVKSDTKETIINLTSQGTSPVGIGTAIQTLGEIISGKPSEVANELLKTLFHSVDKAVNERGLGVFNEIIKKIKE